MRILIPLYLWRIAIYRNTERVITWGKSELPVRMTRYRIKCLWLGPVCLAIYPVADRLRRWGPKPHKGLLVPKKSPAVQIDLLPKD